MEYQHYQKNTMILLSHTFTNPWAVMVVFSNTPPTLKTMLRSHFFDASTDITVLIFINFTVELLLFIIDSLYLI